MEYRENPMFGRKVFFLNPPLSIENVVSEALKNDEFEIYVIREYELAKPLLKKFPNALCWIFIDDILTFDAWYNFIKSFEYDDELKSVFLGVLTARAKPKDQENFLLNLRLPGGFVRLDQKTEDVIKQLKGILDINGARGVRKYIRLDIDSSLDVNGYFSNGSNLCSLKIKDISPMGFAAITPAGMARLFPKGSFIKNISITLGRYSFTCTIQILKTTIINKSCLVVAFFTDDMRDETRKKIHDFIFQTLQTRFKILQENTPWDNTNYNAAPRIGGSESEDAEKSEETKTDENKPGEEVIEDGEAVEEESEEKSEKTEVPEKSETTEKTETADAATSASDVADASAEKASEQKQ